MKYRNKILFTILFPSTIFFGCSKSPSEISNKEKRTFFMGTTPWPADLTVAEVDKTY